MNDKNHDLHQETHKSNSEENEIGDPQLHYAIIIICFIKFHSAVSKELQMGTGMDKQTAA